MLRRRWDRWRAALAALALAASLGACAGAEAPRPNLLLITVDTLRADALACYGGQPDVGTALCALAQRGTRFAWGLSAAPSTAPSIASILTSRYPSDHGVTQFAVTRLPEEAITVTELLRDAGYTTAAFVSNPVLKRARNLDQGFEIYDDRMTRRERNRRSMERDAAATSDAALAWARLATPPWFLWVHYQDPHGPYAPPEAAPARDRSSGAKLPVLRDHSGHRGIPAYQFLPGAFSAETYAERYREEIRYLDRHLARLVEGVEALGSSPGILVTADHGEAFGEDGYYFAHGHSVGLEQLRVPLLWRPPGGGPARTGHTPVGGVDVAPTLLAAAGLPAPESFRGRALTDGAEPEARAVPPRALFAEHRKRAAVVLGDRYYARDRSDFAAPAEDRITGGTLYPLPARSARLRAGEERLPAYAGVDESEALEALLASFLAGGGAQPELDASTQPEATREQLRALGYLE